MKLKLKLGQDTYSVYGSKKTRNSAYKRLQKKHPHLLSVDTLISGIEILAVGPEEAFDYVDLALGIKIGHAILSAPAYKACKSHINYV